MVRKVVIIYKRGYGRCGTAMWRAWVKVIHPQCKFGEATLAKLVAEVPKE